MARILSMKLRYQGAVGSNPDIVDFGLLTTRLVLEQTQSGGSTLDVWPLVSDTEGALETEAELAALESYIVSESTLWKLTVTYQLPGMSSQPVTWLAFSGFSVGSRSIVRDEHGRVRQFRLVDWLGASRQIGSGVDLTFENTDSLTLLGKIVDKVASAGREEGGWDRGRYEARTGVVTTPNVKIPKIIIPRGENLWNALSPYFDPWGPLAQFMVSTSSVGGGSATLGDGGRLHIIDLIEQLRGARAAGSLAGNRLTDLDVHRAEFVESQGTRVDQVRISSRPPYGAGTPTPIVDFDERLESDPLYIAEDGTTVKTGRIWWDLHEDEEHKDLVTRTILKGLFQRSYAPPPAPEEGDEAPAGPTGVPLIGMLVASTETRYTYVDDYQRITRADTTTGAMVDLPAIGRIYRPDAETLREDTDWIDDPLELGAFIKRRVAKLRSGLVIAVNDAEGNPVLGSAVDALRATRSRTVDTSAASVERWLSAPIMLTVERYEPKGEEEVLVLATDTDLLRGITLPARPAETVARASVRVGVREVVEWAGLDTAFSPAVRIDATAIGLENARDLATRALEIGGLSLANRLPRIVRGVVEPLWFDPSRFQIAKVVRWEGQKYANSYAVVGARYEFAVTEDGVSVDSAIELWTPFGEGEGD